MLLVEIRYKDDDDPNAVDLWIPILSELWPDTVSDIVEQAQSDLCITVEVTLETA